MKSANCIYNSSGCNRNAHSLDISNNKVICYAAKNAVHLYEFEKNNGGMYVQTLLGHKKTVTSVHWIKRTDDAHENTLVTTSADHTAVVWSINENKLTSKLTLLGHTDVVRNASGIILPKNNSFIATLAIDSTMKIWQCIDQTVECIQTESFGNGFGLDVKFATLHGDTEIILILAADDSKIHIYTKKNSVFSRAVSLKGHEDWIQSLDTYMIGDNLLIASGSQDHFIRIWKISPKTLKENSFHEGYLTVDEINFSTEADHNYSVCLESVLSGHENWIYSVRWHMDKNDSDSSLHLLSASMDKTMIIWEIDNDTKIWTEKIRVGEVGGNTLGFLGGVYSDCGEIIVGHGFQGAIHIWELNRELQTWEPGLTFGGHFSAVMDIDWDPEGAYLISCSYDQTVRIHAPYICPNGKEKWFEIARPQVHGYDMVCLSLLDRFKYVSAGDEKVLRVFQAPKNFAESLQNILNIDISSYVTNNLAEGASVPSLGLSNKAVFEDDLNRLNISEKKDFEKHPKDRYPDFYYTPLHLKAPPTEETLIQNTLWPEIQKLYGHPYEVFTVAANHSSTLIASACKASKSEHAAVILWDTSNWKQVGQLVFHNLTVTQLEFSPDDDFLLSVSRDRRWAVYGHFPSETPPYKLIANLDKKNNIHSRIIWSCSWSFDSLYFATASRDQKIAVWGRTAKAVSEAKFVLESSPLDVEDSVTALSFAPVVSNSRYIIAIGLENGCILINTWSKSCGFSYHLKLDSLSAHCLRVNRLKFSPKRNDEKCDTLQLASCSNDCHIKIYNIFLPLK